MSQLKAQLRDGLRLSSFVAHDRCAMKSVQTVFYWVPGHLSQVLSVFLISVRAAGWWR